MAGTSFVLLLGVFFLVSLAVVITAGLAIWRSNVPRCDKCGRPLVINHKRGIARCYKCDAYRDEHVDWAETPRE